MHPPQVRTRVLDLVDAGHNDCQIARFTGVPRTTVRDMRTYREAPRPRGRHPWLEMEVCLRCWSRVRRMRFTAADYAELLGLYLGDGCISERPRTSRLRIALDAKYPDIIRDAKRLLERVFPDNPVGLVEAHDGTMFFVSVYSTHLTCLFPQAGDGRKHERPIVLEDWQRRLVEDAPWSLLRGLIRSDGCVFINRTGRYEYLSYDFTNKSKTSRSCSPGPATSSASNTGLRAGASRGVFGSTAAPASSSCTRMSASRRSHAKFEHVTRLWRNWHTRWLQEPLGASPWRFESSQPHSRLAWARHAGRC
jgi:hypothetical protein